ncbi:Uncharacterised protein [Neisseria zoodegmatis]|uniref:Uncharacterized protein n=1 Tax=Neisseria zoodegmatis TaxID=326523 RepID=A0A378WU19_9NEIS|nr:hypothetical protein [Neisseria zoodegmatis]SUA43981.1 Uncharacterised protein [Neisseria zoodegmatis]
MDLLKASNGLKKWLNNCWIFLNEFRVFLFENRDSLFAYFRNLTPIILLASVSIFLHTLIKLKSDWREEPFLSILFVWTLVTAIILFVLNVADLWHKLIQAFPKFKEYEQVVKESCGKRLSLRETISYLREHNGDKQVFIFLVVHFSSICITVLSAMATASNYMKILPELGRICKLG